MAEEADGEEVFLPHSVRRSVDACLAELAEARFVERIWQYDETLWSSNQAETRQRLGWLHAPETMLPSEDSWTSLREDVTAAGFHDAVLLGMGGSSLGAEVLNQMIGRSEGQPRLHVLDSTVPEAIAAVASAIHPERTLFIVSSKSGSTVEPNLLYDYFRAAVKSSVGESEAGSHFVAITDPGSSLEKLAREQGFRYVFLNPANIGGRYSVLSLFGLVPGAILGIDNNRLLRNAGRMHEACRDTSSPSTNPGIALAAYMVGCQRVGRDKLTLLASPRAGVFGLWAEQLVAESTGKQGTGIIPVVGEPYLSPESYSTDRAFIYLRLDGDNNRASDEYVTAIEDEGFPCLTLSLQDPYAIGDEFFRWEFATAAAGCLLDINPFDQPDVQSAKDASVRVLKYHDSHGTLPELPETLSPSELVESFTSGTYLAVMAYLRQSEGTDAAFAEFRRHVGEQHCICTTLGYGPRFLHSTGQLHKGGPDSGAFLQIVSAHAPDDPIAGHPYGFSTVADAQALGDLEALQGMGRTVARITLDDDSEDTLRVALETLV